jgi:hypothetical protein
MLSQRAKGWRWYDWLVVFFVAIIACVIIEKTLPTSGLAQALHTAFHFLALLSGWIANGFIALAGLLNQL